MNYMKRNMIIGSALLVALWTAQTALAWYAPSTGRWLTRDPIGEPGFQTLQAAHVAAGVPASSGRWINRDPLGKPGFDVLRRRAPSPLAGDPNRYIFVRNNPNGFIDTDGLDVIAIPFPVGGVGAGGIGLGGAIGIGLGVGVGTGLLLDTYTPVGSIGTAIANRVCPRGRPYRETCFLANEVEGYCIYNCPSGPRVFPVPPTGCPNRFTFKFPNPLNPTWRP